MTSRMSRQFESGKNDDGAKDALLKQLGKSFHEKDLQWINDPQIHVKKETVSPSEIDWDHRDEWAATHEPEKVAKKRKKIEHGKDKPVVLVNRPHKGPDNLFIMDGHHHAEAYTQLDKDMPAFVVSVPKTKGPWDSLHDRQIESSPDA